MRWLGELDTGDTLESSTQAGGHLVGVRRRAKPQVTLEHRNELGRDKAHLRRELHVHLAQVNESVDALRGEDDDGLGAEETVLGSAETQDVDTGIPRELAKWNAERGGRVGDACPIHVKSHALRMRVVGECANLRRRVHRPQFT